MDLKPSQFTIGRMLHATAWFAAAATLFSAARRPTELHGLFALGGFIALGIGIGLLCGRRILGTVRGRSICSLICGSASLVLKGVSMQFARRGMHAAAQGQGDVAYGMASYSDWFGAPSAILALTAIALAIYARSTGSGWFPRAALIVATVALLFQLVLV
jgi:hypothetical protein